MDKRGWVYKKFGDISSFYRGLTYSGKDEVDYSSNIVLRSNNVDLESYTLNLNELKYISEEISIPSDKMVKKDSLLMCMSNGSKQHLGKVAFIEKDLPYAFGGFMGLILPDKAYLYPKFLYYYCCSSAYKSFLLTIGNGANINNLKFSEISKNIVPLPPLATQASIVAELDKINHIISQKKEQIKDLDKLAQSLFYEMFGDPVENEKGWEATELGNLFDVKGGKRIPKGFDYSKEVTSHPYLRASDMKNNTILDNDIHYISDEVFNLIKRYTVKAGDIYLTNVGVNLGMAGIIPPKFDGANLTENAVKLVYKDEKYCSNIDLAFLSRYLNSSEVQIYINARKMTVGVPKLAIFRIESIPLILPPLALQHSFAKKIEAIEAHKTAVQASIADLQTLLDARMQEYFG